MLALRENPGAARLELLDLGARRKLGRIDLPRGEHADQQVLGRPALTVQELGRLVDPVRLGLLREKAAVDHGLEHARTRFRLVRAFSDLGVGQLSVELRRGNFLAVDDRNGLALRLLGAGRGRSHQSETNGKY